MFSRSISDEEAKKQYDYDRDDEFGGACFVPESIRSDCDEYMKLIGCEFGYHCDGVAIGSARCIRIQSFQVRR